MKNIFSIGPQIKKKREEHNKKIRDLSIEAAKCLQLRGLGLSTTKDKRARVPKNKNVKASGFAFDIGSKIAELLNPIKKEDKLFDNLKIEFKPNFNWYIHLEEEEDEGCEEAPLSYFYDKLIITGLPQILHDSVKSLPRNLELKSTHDTGYRCDYYKKHQVSKNLNIVHTLKLKNLTVKYSILSDKNFKGSFESSEGLLKMNFSFRTNDTIKQGMDLVLSVKDKLFVHVGFHGGYDYRKYPNPSI